MRIADQAAVVTGGSAGLAGQIAAALRAACALIGEVELAAPEPLTADGKRIEDRRATGP